MTKYTRYGTEVRQPMTFKIEPSLRKLIKAEKRRTKRRSDSETVREIVVRYFEANPANEVKSA